MQLKLDVSGSFLRCGGPRPMNVIFSLGEAIKRFKSSRFLYHKERPGVYLVCFFYMDTTMDITIHCLQISSKL